MPTFLSAFTVKVNAPVPVLDLAALYSHAGLPDTALDEHALAQMLASANVVVSAWADGHLIGVARCFTDFCFVCFLAELAVLNRYQRTGIGTAMLAELKSVLLPTCSVVALSLPTARGFYETVGFSSVANAYMANREDMLSSNG